jgi:predicted porin
MKKIIAAIVPGLLTFGHAYAQSSVTLYGVVDTSVLYQNHANPSGGHLIQMTDGAVNASRFGLKGNEDLGGGLSTIFDLEGGFQPESGALDSSNTLFNRHAYVGLQGNWGTVTLGRQDTLFFTTLANYDPLTVGNYYNNSWYFYQSDARYSNMVKYEGTFHGLYVGASYGLGGQPGSISAGSQAAISLSYTTGPFSVGGVFSQTHALNNKTQNIGGIAASYAIGPTTLYVGFSHNDDGSGLTEEGLTVQPVTVGTADVRRKDTGFFTGAIWQVKPDIYLTAAYYYDSMRDAYSTAGDDGHRQSVAFFAQYLLSKRTYVYATADYNKVQGQAALVELPGADNQFEAGIGLHHSF